MWPEREVAAIYNLYPRKVARKKAVAKIEQALDELRRRGERDPIGYLKKRVKAFADSPKGRAGQFCPYPATWFNQGRYDDDPDEWREGEEVMTYAEARAHWQKRGEPGQFPGTQYERVDRGRGNPLWRYAA